VVTVSVGMLILRIVVGLLFIGHGTQKLFGWFGGGGREGTTGMVGSLGYRSPELIGLLGGLAEAIGGLLLLLGFLTPVGTALIVAMMISAILAVHAPNGVWNTNNGIELPVVYIAAAFAAAVAPGRYSLDRVIGWGWNQRFAAMIALTVGIVAGVVAAVAFRTPPGRRAEPAAPPTEEIPRDRAA
jgi:putative oxidoreductase